MALFRIKILDPVIIKKATAFKMCLKSKLNINRVFLWAPWANLITQAKLPQGVLVHVPVHWHLQVQASPIMKSASSETSPSGISRSNPLPKLRLWQSAAEEEGSHNALKMRGWCQRQMNWWSFFVWTTEYSGSRREQSETLTKSIISKPVRSRLARMARNIFEILVRLSKLIALLKSIII